MSEFAYRICLGWSPEDEAYVASVAALGVLAHGDSVDEAAREARAAGELMLESLADDDRYIPPHDCRRTFSGNIRLRIPKGLHRELAERAQDEGVSLNTLMVALLATGVGERPRGEQERGARPIPAEPAA